MGLDNDELILEKLMRGKLIESDGANFEDLFCQIMKKKDENFVKIRPYGNIGDRKNDGYIRNKGKFYQVNGPIEFTSTAVQTANLKIDEDFSELKKHCDAGSWEELKHWVFVFNDKGKGNSPILEKKISDLNAQCGIPCEIMGIDEILKIFESLTRDDKKRLGGFCIFNPNEITFKFEIFSNIFNYFKENINVFEIYVKMENEDYNVNPDLEKKVSFNNLDEKKRLELTLHNEYVYHLDEFLEKNFENPSIGKEHFITLYKRAKELWIDSNEQYDYIFQNSYPRTGLSLQDKSIYDCHIKIIMSKYFECCDIFEPCRD